jgi:hypothetical protein
MEILSLILIVLVETKQQTKSKAYIKRDIKAESGMDSHQMSSCSEMISRSTKTPSKERMDKES